MRTRRTGLQTVMERPPGKLFCLSAVYRLCGFSGLVVSVIVVLCVCILALLLPVLAQNCMIQVSTVRCIALVLVYSEIVAMC
jgi:hypothetical protein